MLELGSYVAPAYAGMVLAEQGHYVEKWATERDPVLTLKQGDELWSWLNDRKHVCLDRHLADVLALHCGDFDVVLDNVRAATWHRLGVDVTKLAELLDVTWVSLRADDDGRSFDVIAQARAWGDLGVLPFYLGDTAAGLWLAFKALAAPRGHHVVRQAAALAKLVEGEAIIERPAGRYPYDDAETYCFDDDTARVVFKGELIVEPARDAAWRRAHLANVRGRFVV